MRAHLAGQDDHFVKIAPVLERVGDFAAFLAEDFNKALHYAALRKAKLLGWPIGTKQWLADMEARTGMTFAPQRRGPASKTEDRFDIWGLLQPSP